MDKEIKACPFCGGEGKLRIKSFDIFNNVAFVECLNCGAQTARISAGVQYTAVDRAIDLWNRRAKD